MELETNSFNSTDVKIKQVANVNTLEPDGEDRGLVVHKLIEPAVGGCRPNVINVKKKELNVCLSQITSA